MKMTPAAQKRNIPLLALDPLRINHQSHALPVFLQLILTTNPFPPRLQPTGRSLQGRNAISFQPIKVYNWPHAYLINYSSLECNYELNQSGFSHCRQSNVEQGPESKPKPKFVKSFSSNKSFLSVEWNGSK